MGGAEEEWVKAAMTDDTMVVELLVRLHCTPPLPPPPPPTTLPLEWALRQRRSRPVSVNMKKLAQSQRASPSTPLSWSGATSLSGGSGGGGGSEESSRPHSQKLFTASRSKLNGDNEKVASKRSSRKKKTLAELKDEENTLLKERRELKREISALRINLEKQRDTNEKLKRIKIKLQPLPDTETTSGTKETASARLQQMKTAGPPIPPIMPPIISGNAVALQSSTSNDCPTPPNADAPSSPPFVLPDLNMPFEEPCPEVICSVS